ERTIERPKHVAVGRGRFGYVFAESLECDRARIEIERAFASAQLLQDRADSADPVYVLDVHVGSCRADLAQRRHSRGYRVEPFELIFNFAFASDRQRMQYSVCRASHRNVECKRVVDRIARDKVARFEPGIDKPDDLMTRTSDEFSARL